MCGFSLCRGSGSRFAGVRSNIVLCTFIHIIQHIIDTYCIHYRRCAGIDNRKIQPMRHCKRQESGGDFCSGRQSKGDIRHAEYTVQPVPHHLHRTQRFDRFVLFGGDGERQAVNKYIFFWNTIFQRFMQDAFGYRKAGFCRGRNAVCVHCQPDNCCTVLFREREYAGKHLRFTIDGVNNCFAVHNAQPGLNRRRVGGIKLDRQVRYRLYGLDHPNHHSRFINAGQSDVDIQNMRSRVGLFDCLCEDIIKVVFPQRLLESLFSGGVDAFADDAHAVNRDSICWGTDHGFSHDFPRRDGQRLDFFCKFGNKCRGCSAASAHVGNAKCGKTGHLVRKFGGGDVVFAGGRVRETGICFHDDGQCGCSAQPFSKGIQLVRAKRTVHANGIRAQAF